MKNKCVGNVVLSEEQIKLGVLRVSEILNKKFMGEEVVVITIVPGGILFTADLVRKLRFDIGMDYVSCPHNAGRKDE